MPQIGDWSDVRGNYATKLSQYQKWLEALDTQYFRSCRGNTSLDGVTGSIVRRAVWDLGNLVKWLDGPVFLVAYCTRSLLELTVMMWSLDRDKDFRRWYGYMASDLIELAADVTGASDTERNEMEAVVQDFKNRYAAAGVEIPKGHENSRIEARRAGYLREYDDVFRLLSKYVHPTPLTLLLPTQMTAGPMILRYFYMRSLKYLRTVYCLAAAQSGYNPAGDDVNVTRELEILRADLDK